MTKQGTIYCKKVDESKLAKVAHILGNSSAASKALRDLKEKRDAGNDVFVYDVIQNNWRGYVVCPPLVEIDELDSL